MNVCARRPYLFFFCDTSTTEIYTLSLHDALPISRPAGGRRRAGDPRGGRAAAPDRHADRKSTRLNSSHEWISYAVFCLKKKKSLAIRHVCKACAVGVLVALTKFMSKRLNS